MEERRRFVRLDTRLETTCTVLPTGAAKTTVAKDISGGGICLFAESILAPGTHLQVAMKLPDRPQPINFSAEVVWCEPYEVIGKTERQRAVEIGVKFLEISPQDREAILQRVILNLKQPRSA